MPIQKLISAWGLTKQSAKGVPDPTPATADYGAGIVGSGSVFQAPIESELEAQTLFGAANDRFAPAIHRVGVSPGAAFTTRVWPRSIGALLMGALGTVNTTPGSPDIHVFSPAIDLPYHTFYARLAAEYVRLPDTKIDELTIGWEERGPLAADVVAFGLAPALDATAWTATNDETTQAFFGPTGGTFQIDVDGTVLAATQLKSGSVHIMNGLTGIPLSKSVLPDDVFPGAQAIDGTITVIPENLNDWQAILTGTPTGTGVRETTVYGSFSLKVVVDANTDLVLASTRVEFITDFPEGDAAGGPVELPLAFRVVRPTDGSNAFTATLRNEVVGY